MRGLVRFIVYPQTPGTQWVGALWAVAATFGVGGQSLCQHHLFRGTQRLGCSMRAALSGAVYRKLLRLRAADAAAASLSSGRLANLVVNDAKKLDDASAL